MKMNFGPKGSSAEPQSPLESAPAFVNYLDVLVLHNNNNCTTYSNAAGILLELVNWSSDYMNSNRHIYFKLVN